MTSQETGEYKEEASAEATLLPSKKEHFVNNNKKEMAIEWGSWSINLLSICLCLSAGFQQGYIASVLNQPYAELKDFINGSYADQTGVYMTGPALNMTWSFLNVCFPASTIIGQFLAAFLCKRIGRKKTAMVACLLYIPGSLISSLAKYTFWFELLFVSRVLWSVGNGIATVNATVWIIECAPSSIRGRIAALQEFAMAVGAAVTQGLGVPFADDHLWPFMFYPNAIICAVTFVLLFFVWESPQFIVAHDKDTKKARAAIAAYQGLPVTDEKVDVLLKKIEDSVRGSQEKEERTAEEDKTKSQENLVSEQELAGVTIMFNPWRAKDARSRVIRIACWMGAMIKIGYVLTGARGLRGYATYLLEGLGGWTGDEAKLGSLVISLVRLPMTLVPVLVVDRLGRRPLILLSICVSLASLAAMVAATNIGASWKWVTLISLATLLLINACGLGSVSRFYAGELVPRHLLLSTVSIVNNIEMLTKIGIEFAWFPLANAIGAQSLLLFLVPTTLFVVIVWLCAPETSKRDVNEVLNSVAKRHKIDAHFE